MTYKFSEYKEKVIGELTEVLSKIKDGQFQLLYHEEQVNPAARQIVKTYRVAFGKGSVEFKLIDSV